MSNAVLLWEGFVPDGESPQFLQSGDAEYHARLIATGQVEIRSSKPMLRRYRVVVSDRSVYVECAARDRLGAVSWNPVPMTKDSDDDYAPLQVMELERRVLAWVARVLSSAEDGKR